MVVSTHHHLRNGDAVANAAFDTAAEMGVRDLMWFPVSLLSGPRQPDWTPRLGRHPSHRRVDERPLGAYCSAGKMRGLGVLRSHGGRWQAIQDGEVHIDVAVIAAPARGLSSATPTVSRAPRPAGSSALRSPTRSTPRR